jgi:hypothetical protein
VPLVSRYLPAFFEAATATSFSHEVAFVEDVAGLLALPWIKNLQCAQGFIRFSQRQDLLVMYLMAEYERHGGVASYVVAMMDQEMPGIPVSDEG